MRSDGTTLTDVLEVEAALAAPATEEDAAPPEPEALEDEPEPEAVVAAANFSTPPVNVTGTPATTLPEKLVVVTTWVFTVVTPATSISRLRVI
jgi:hypothetical protein